MLPLENSEYIGYKKRWEKYKYLILKKMCIVNVKNKIKFFITVMEFLNSFTSVKVINFLMAI